MPTAITRHRAQPGPGRILAAALVLAAVALAGPVRAAEIVVSAEGEVTAAPDMATLRIGVRERADTAEAAMQAASSATAALLEVLEAAGVARADLRTSELSLAPLWRSDGDGGAPVAQGFEAANMVTARMRGLGGDGGADPGEVLGAAVAAGANRLDGLSFGLADPQAAMDRARRRAVAEALRRGALLAEAAGIDLPPVRRIEDDGAQAPRPMMMRAAEMDMGAAAPVAAGDITVTARVTVVFGPAE